MESIKGLITFILLMATAVDAQGALATNFYQTSCPPLFRIVNAGVRNALAREPRMGASLLRLHFHDCFVQGCDASILLDDTATMIGEKSAPPNNNSVRGYEVIDSIKSQVEAACPGVVSCADILAIVARDSVAILGGPSWNVELGRRDSLSPGSQTATRDLPPPTFNLSALISSFSKKGLSTTDLVALSGGHTIGQSRCVSFRSHIYNDTNINTIFAILKQKSCPSDGGDENLAALDFTTANRFDNAYFRNLLGKRGLLHSDQELFNGVSTDSLVSTYARIPNAFFRDFASAMLKMGRLDLLTGSDGQVRGNCRRVN